MTRTTRISIVAVLAAALMLGAACGGDDDDGDAGSDGGGSAAASTQEPSKNDDGGGSSSNDGGGSSAGDALTVEAWTGEFCSAYAAFDDGIRLNDGIDPTTLDLEARAERANRAARETAEASADLLDVLYDMNPPPALSTYHELVIDRVEFLMWDMEDFVEDPAESLQDVEDLGITYAVRVEFLTNTMEAEFGKLAAADAEQLTAGLEGDTACSAVPR
jgi:hypothetical protein